MSIPPNQSTNYPQTGSAANGGTIPTPGQAGYPNYPPPAGPPPIPGNHPGTSMPVPQHDPNAHYAQQPQMYPPPVHVEPQHLQYNGHVVPNPRAPPLPHGVAKAQGYNPFDDAATIYKALDRFNVDEKALIKTLPKIGILKMDALADCYVANYGKQLVDHIDNKKSGDFAKALHALAVGPLVYDVELLNEALAGAGTNEQLLTELIMDRSSEDLYRLSVEYRYKYGADLSVNVQKDLSGSAAKLFLLALNARRPPDNTPIDFAAVDKDILDLFVAYQTGRNDLKVDEMVFFSIIVTRSRPHLAAVVQGYGQKYRSLTKVIKKAFPPTTRLQSNHTGDALKYVIEGVKPKRDGQGVWRDAKRIEKAMKGWGTDSTALRYRIIRAHWNPERMAAITKAYHNRFGKTLEARVKDEISNKDYETLMLAILKAEQH